LLELLPTVVLIIALATVGKKKPNQCPSWYIPVTFIKVRQVTLGCTEVEQSLKEVQGLHFPHLALAFPVVVVVGWLTTFKKPTVNRKLMREV